MEADVRHRDIDYEVREIAPSRWRWTIYPKIEDGPKVVGESEYQSSELAGAACRAEIDQGLDARNA